MIVEFQRDDFADPLSRIEFRETTKQRDAVLEMYHEVAFDEFGKVEELAGAAVFLSSDAASFVAGEVLVVDGGLLASGVNQ